MRIFYNSSSIELGFMVFTRLLRLTWFLPTLSVFCCSIITACNSSEKTLEETVFKDTETLTVEPISITNLLNCRNQAAGSTPVYSISPNGEYLVSIANEKSNNQHGRYVKDGVSYAGFRALNFWKITGDLKLPKTLHELIFTSSGKNDYGYGWSSDSKLFYHGLNYTEEEGRPYLTAYNPKAGTVETYRRDTENGFENFKYAHKRLEGQIALSENPYRSKNRLGGLNLASNQTDWRPNIYGEITIGLTREKESGIKVIKFSKTQELEPYSTFITKVEEGKIKQTRNPVPRSPHPARIGWEYDSSEPVFDQVKVFPSDYFRTFENRQANPLENDKRVSHFYYLTNSDRNHISLFRYEDVKDSPKHSLIYAPNADITHVSFNRDGSKPYWAISENDFPEYEFFGDEAKELFDLIKVPTTAKVEILSMDKSENRVVIKAVSQERGYEYLLVDMRQKTRVLLESCPGASKMPWANVLNLSFIASDGELVSGYIYTPLNTISLQKNILPTIIYAHGGPSAREYSTPDNTYVKALVERGYAVVLVNYRGSIGYGRRFREAGWQNPSRSRHDIIEAAQKVINDGIADPNRMAVMGNSYGGYLALSMTLEPATPFKAAISRNGISDPVNFLEVPFYKSNGKVQNYNDDGYVFGDVKDPENKDKLNASSALNNIDLINMPIFLAHALNDDRVPKRQSKKLYDAILKNRADIRVEYQELNGGHHISDMDVFDEYIEGVDGFLREIFEN